MWEFGRWWWCWNSCKNSGNQLLENWRLNVDFNGVEEEMPASWCGNSGNCEQACHALKPTLYSQPMSSKDERKIINICAERLWWCTWCSGYLQLIYWYFIIMSRFDAKVVWRDITSAYEICFNINPKEEFPSLWGLNVSGKVVQIAWVRNRKNWDSSHLPSEEKNAEANLVLIHWTVTRSSSFNLFGLWCSTVTLVGVCCHLLIRSWCLSLDLIWWDFWKLCFYGPMK